MKRYFLLVKQWHNFENIGEKKWIWETLKQIFDKYLLTGMKPKIDLMDAMKWEVKPIKSSNFILKAAKIYLLSACISLEDV